MLRNPALQDLSRDHFTALKHCQAIRWAIEGHARSLPLEDVTTEFLQFWDDEAFLHFREEEEVLLPVCSRHFLPSEEPAVRRMLDDHAWLRGQVEALRAARARDEDTRALIQAIGERLDAHVRLEEREVFPRVQARFSEADFEELWERSKAFREAARGADCIGPRLYWQEDEGSGSPEA